jgi:hypothetical protein
VRSCRPRRLVSLVLGVVGTAILWGGSPAVAAAKPEFQMPFACGERWEGSTRPSHSPSSLAVDWNRDAYDLGKIAVASAPGVVTSVVNLGNRSYGRYVVIDHGGGWTTLHAHLSAFLVTVGQHVDQGQPIALVGNSGGSSGAHLHYEQRLNKVDRHAEFNARSFVYGSWLKSHNCVDVPVVGDWNGDRLSDVGVFGRQPVAGVYRLRMPDGTRQAVTLGLPTDTPVVGDWNGDGQSDLGVWRATTQTFFKMADSGKKTAVVFGSRSSLPVVGDWDGDGLDDVGVFEPPTATFLLRDGSGSYSSRYFGTTAGLPIAGDWDGDGRDDVGVYDQATTTFRLAMSDDTVKTVVFGTTTGLPVVGHWNTDGRSDLGIWDPFTGTFTERLGPNRSTAVRFGRLR